MIILGYHDIDPSERNAWTLAPQRFEAQLAYLKERGFEFVSLADGLVRCHEADTSADCAKLAVLTFDDQRLGCWEHGLSILTKFKAPAMFFVCPGLWLPEIPKNERYSEFMAQSQVRQLALRGYDIGSHAMRHASMIGQHMNDLKRQVYFSMVELYKVTGKWVEHFAPPYGDYDEITQGVVMDSGYLSLVTTDPGYVGNQYNYYALPRYQVRSDDHDETFKETIYQLENASAYSV